MLKFYLLSALRVHKRNKWITLINLVGLSIGLALFLEIALFIRNELRNDHYHEKIDRIARIETTEFVAMPMNIKSLLGEEIPGIEQTVRLSYLLNKAYLWNGKNTFKVTDMLVADREIFEVFSFDFIYGDPSSALSDPKSVVLTETNARKFFGTEDPIGKQLRYNNKFNLTVTGVIKDLPHNSTIWAGMIGSIELFAVVKGSRDYMEDYNDWSHYAFVLLEKDASIQETSIRIHRKLNDEIHQMMNAWYFTIKFRLTPMGSLYFGKGPQTDSFNHGSWRIVFIYSGIALFILLIAIINFINLSNATAFRRSREIGLKKLSGASKWDLLSQLLIESVLLSILSMGFAFILFDLIYPVFNTLTTANIMPQDLYNPVGIIFCILFAILTGIIAGLWPAFFLIKFKPVNILKGSFSGTKTGLLTRRALLVFQFFISVVLIIVATVIYGQRNYAMNMDLGFNKDQILYFPVNGDISKHRDEFIAELNTIPGIQKAGFTSSMPGYVNMNWGPKVDGVTRRFDAICSNASFIDVLGLQIKEGRNFFEGSQNEISRAYIVNETFVKSFELEPAIGKSILQGKIVGVVKDFTYKPANTPIGPLAIAYMPDLAGTVAVKISPENITSTISAIEKVWNQYASGFPFEYNFLNDAINKLYKKEERLSHLFGYFSLLSIMIACMGIAGLAMNTLRIRSKEISIRKIFGAPKVHLVIVLLWEFIKWLFIASIIAWPVAWYVCNEWLSNFAYHPSISIWVFILSTLSATFIVILVVLYNILHNINKNPAKALSWE